MHSIQKEAAPALTGAAVKCSAATDNHSKPCKTVPQSPLLAAGVSQFQLVTSTRPKENKPLRWFIEAIKTGRWRDEIEDLRETYRLEGPAAYKESRKTMLEAFTASGIFRERSTGGLFKHSGVAAVDFDDLGERLPALRAQLIADGRALCVFTSPSGHGLKALVPVDATDIPSHNAAYEAALSHYSRLGVQVDKTCRDVSRLCFVSYDPGVWVNPSPSLSLFSAPTPTPTTTLYTLHTTLQKEEKGHEDIPVSRVGRLKKLEREQPELYALYETQVMRRITLAPGKRNEALTMLVPYLHRAVSEPVAAKLASLIVTLNPDIVNGTKEEQMTSLKSLWDGCEERYAASLSPEEASLYRDLDDDTGERAAFRILRDLAVAGDGRFFMSCDQLTARLGGVNGWRMLNRFSGGYRILEKTEEGTKRQKGVRGRAAYYRWVPPLPLSRNAGAEVAAVVPIVEPEVAGF